jgi:regulator of extracellular matrix RemA (YlzA/DUF370 family)
MSGLWTNDRATLAAGIWGHVGLDATVLAQHLIDKGTVRVLDPDDTDLVGRIIDEIADELHLVDPSPERLARAVIVALRQP